MDFRILGPLEVTDEGRRVELGGRKQRALLAILLLHPNEIVSADKLIDELWGEAPPPTATRTLQAHISRLRKSIGTDRRSKDSGRLETRGHGYVLRIEVGQLDADRFQRLLEDGRRALARGEAGSAVEKVDQALALWRGPALADFAYDSFAQRDIARLEELRLSALEERIEANIALGRHSEVIAELEALVAGHPLRERLRGQLMLALYRSDRQAEALDAYQRGRQALAEELGLEPSKALQRLERQILEHDPSLAAPARAEAPTAGAAVPRGLRRLLVVGGVILAAVAGLVVFQLARDGTEAATRNDRAVDRSGVGVLDPRTGELRETIPAGTAPSAVAVGEGSVWVLDADDKTVARIDPGQRKVVRTFSIATRPTALGAGAGAVWVGNGFRDPGFGGSYPASVSRVDRESGVVDETIRLPREGGQPYFPGGGFEQQLMAVSRDAVWVVNTDGTVTRIDPEANRVVAKVSNVRAQGIAAGEGQVWVIDDEGVAQIDPRRNRISKRIEVAAESLTALAIGSGALWVADPAGGSVWRIAPEPDPVLRTIPLDSGVGWVAFGEGAVWATNEIADKVYRIDPGTYRARVVAHVPAPAGVAVGEDAVWVAAAGPPSAEEVLPASTCSSVHYAGRGSPRFLIVSDLPLQPGSREFTLPMVKGIRFVLERRGFRAGKYTVGYQSCDDSTAQAGGFDIYRCISNAKAYARTPDVVGVIGSFISPCTSFQLPVANQAPGGPLAMISPSNTDPGLTRPQRGSEPGELEELYPSGERNYVRIATPDNALPVAVVKLARELGRRRVFVAWDGEDDSMAGFAPDVRQSAPGLGLDMVGRGAWNPHARVFARLARRIAAARPDAVVMAGASPPFVGELIHELREELGPEVVLIGSVGFDAFPDLIEDIGAAATGMYVTRYGIPNSKLPPAGKRFLRQFDAAGGGPNPDQTAAYGAQAAEILLDAIARSDGTRSSVTRELFKTRVEDGILGDIRFDENGDLVKAPVTIFRIAGRRPVVDRVVMASLATP
jgi:DNA-binding SARP family transcriptional activator/ABC-type branched-subunit amino acid transport system substrate-binding protein/streptogramin lyase